MAAAKTLTQKHYISDTRKCRDPLLENTEPELIVSVELRCVPCVSPGVLGNCSQSHVRSRDKFRLYSRQTFLCQNCPYLQVFVLPVVLSFQDLKKYLIKYTLYKNLLSILRPLNWRGSHTCCPSNFPTANWLLQVLLHVVLLVVPAPAQCAR